MGKDGSEFNMTRGITRWNSQDNRNFINAVIWILRTGALWRDLLPDYGKLGTVHQRFIRRQRKVFERNYLRYLKVIKNLNG